MNDVKKMTVSLFMVVLLFVFMQMIGFLPMLSNSAKKIGLAIVGYESKVHFVEGKFLIPIAMMMGVNIEQEIYLPQEVVDREKIMLEIDVANYDRINQGQLVLEIHQGDTVKVFVTDMSLIKKNKTLRLISDTMGLKKGNIIVNMYAPEATGENCVAVYTVSNEKVYSGLIVCGEDTESNACIDLAIPSKFAKSDFTQVNIE